MSQRVHVAVGVIVNPKDEILIARRPEHLHQGGKWEFPGGKVEKGETVEQALRRELKEEVNIDVLATKPFMDIQFDYPDKLVFLDVHKVMSFSGCAKGLEGQKVLWVAKEQLVNFEFPDGNISIVEKLNL